VSEPSKKKKAFNLSQVEEMDAKDLYDIMSMPAGRRFIWRYLGLSKVNEVSFTGNSETFFNEGMRMMGCTLQREVVLYAPKLYLQMISENLAKT
jgi:hypothetical protein